MGLHIPLLTTHTSTENLTETSKMKLNLILLLVLALLPLIHGRVGSLHFHLEENEEKIAREIDDGNGSDYYDYLYEYNPYGPVAQFNKCWCCNDPYWNGICDCCQDPRINHLTRPNNPWG